MVQVSTTVIESASASASLWIGLLEVIADLWNEVLLFGLAIIAYFAFAYLRPALHESPRNKVRAQRGCIQEHRREVDGEKKVKSTLQEPSAKRDGDDAPGTKCMREIRAFCKNGDLAGALTAFEDYVRHGGVATSLLYKTIMDACIECGNVDAAATYFAQAKGKGAVDIVCYNILIKGRLAADEIECAERLLSEIQRDGLKATNASYHGFLNYRVMAGDTRGAWRIIDEMRAAGITPNSLTWSILLKGVTAPCHSDDFLRISAFTDSMDKDLDRPLLGALIEGSLRSRHGELGLRALQKLRSSCSDDLASLTPVCGSMIKYFGLEKDVKHIWAVWREMQRQGMQPTAITLGCMTEALVANGQAHDAWKLVRQIWEDEKQRPLVNTITYSTLLKGFLHQPQNVMSLYKEMRDCGIQSNVVTYNTILNAFAQNGDMQLVPTLLEDMARCQPPVELDVVTCATLIKGYCSSGDVDHALKLFGDMKAGGKIVPDDVMYHCLLDGFAKAHRVNDALRLFDDMTASGLAPSNFTLSILVKLLGRSKRLQQAFTLVEKAANDHGVRPNIQVYTCLMQACFQNKQTAKAVSLLDRIIKEGIKPDERTFSALVQGCVKAGQQNQALELAKRAFHGSRPVGIDAKTLNGLIAKLGKDTKVAQSLLAIAHKSGQTSIR